jgi:hypothetical protein
MIISVSLMFGPVILPIIEESGAQLNEIWIGVILAASFASIPLTMLVVVLSLFLTFFGLVAITHVAVTGDFRAAFRFKEWWPILKRNFGGFLLSALVIYGVSTVLGIAAQILMMTVILCVLMPFVMAAVGAYTYIAGAALFAQAYAAAADSLANATSNPA